MIYVFAFVAWVIIGVCVWNVAMMTIFAIAFAVLGVLCLICAFVAARLRYTGHVIAWFWLWLVCYGTAFYLVA